MIGVLSCTATNCVNNMSGICSASNINILVSDAHSTEETQCGTFAEKGLKNSLTNLLNTNVVGEFRQVFHKDDIAMSPSIKCEATNCIHNEKDLCVADNIIIFGLDAKCCDNTECETFKEQ